MNPSRPSLVAVIKGGWLAGPVLLAALLSPLVENQAEQSLVVHHFAHWSMVAAGALVGYQLRHVVRFPRRALIAWLGLGAALMWHLPPLLSWAEAGRATHMFAHATLVAGGIALGWAVPGLSSATRAFVFITANVVMWPLVLAETAGTFTYFGYAGQAPNAGLAELAAMSASWLVLAVWAPVRRVFELSAVSTAAQALVVVAALIGWL